ncbi:soluble quino protein glucose/sorbosone dehydrogenase [Pseudomassariella vexata]|uniref:Soluble quino protein glucose/sorbosone dehydrogenase n=1 Tax=Pseudomassariella vexata TaxID=1141098 RepID=A0A1Y2DTE9_9PEZI|nr:soluble quino protein glucose/sorbosone dehydrogenase [Pseudomassariella vexata]ORY62416.1 soluble quino protein glucose/sorbosone dehydrogenase [Pseudomassariella vexata]
MRWGIVAAGVVALAGNAWAQEPSALPFPTTCSGVAAARYQYSVSSTWKATKIAGGLRQPRSMIFDPQGNMLVLQATSGISVHTFGADGCINSTKTLVTNGQLNHGLSLTPDGTKLYASSVSTVWQWDYDAATMAVSNQKVVVQGIGQGIHSTRTTLVVPNKPNLLVVQVGSNNNWDMDASSINTGRACVRVFDMSAVPASGYQYNSGGWALGYGLRNEVGLAFDPNGMVWGVENSGDDFARTVNGQRTDIHIDNPAEELNYLGDPSTPSTNWFGYPTCFTVWDGSVIQDATLKTGDQMVVTSSGGANASFPDAMCAEKSIPPRLSFPAHTAPITNVFDADGTNMYVTLHGSWDRKPQASGYKVVQVPFTKKEDGSYDPVAAADSKTGFTDIMWATNLEQCNSPGLTVSSCFRLAGLVFDPAGSRLFVSSDNNAEGELFILGKK